MFSIFTAACVAQFKPSSPSMADVQDDRKELEDFTRPPKWIPFPTTITFRLFEVLKLFDAETTGKGDTDTHPSDLYRFEKSLQLWDAIVVRSCWELETDFLNLLKELHNKPVIPTGQLPPVAFAYNNEDDHDHDEASWKPIKKWLDKQETGTVVYVAFGSEANPSPEEVKEIALGLELSGLPFFWVLRSTIDQLPDGFEDRTKGRGVVWKSWAPQVKILAHDSVGGFSSHGGWSSVVEAITFQRPIILLTFLADQGWNARILEERKMGYVIPRNENDGSFSRDSVAESVRLVVMEEAGQVYRENVKKMKGVFGDQERQDRYIDEFLSFLITNKNILLSRKPIG
ncbi:UDP-glucuronosyl/UDP-glucosyltransferase [Corchorus capsularis]|uniref:UDP-glucuronosyl/UDP-glucosyltransferase n=1 Tax=Corchorus capsularis TaxID=210143 RepID=A0A1R3GE01_COCAP|nr:UDP-glucuronosyl/UDP-glucosyltransferase [Corchorus capsularis]